MGRSVASFAQDGKIRAGTGMSADRVGESSAKKK
jgi:hypothetical protein